jgi:VIT1/CCC1 family predicted Fe2+/Mn2+ transporter
MSGASSPAKGGFAAESKRLLDPVDRISEILFGLIMAVTIVGSLSIATGGREEVRTALVAALGCNLAWGLVDAVMFLLRQLTERKRNVMLARHVAHADRDSAHQMIRMALPPGIAALLGPVEIEAMRGRLLALPAAARAGLTGEDFLAAFGVFLLVVAATFPVVIPFLLTDAIDTALCASRIVTLAMLFLAGYGLGRYAGHSRPVVTGVLMLLLGAALIAAVMALGG